jgi:hypothetical protein
MPAPPRRRGRGGARLRLVAGRASRSPGPARLGRPGTRRHPSLGDTGKYHYARTCGPARLTVVTVQPGWFDGSRVRTVHLLEVAIRRGPGYVTRPRPGRSLSVFYYRYSAMKSPPHLRPGVTGSNFKLKKFSPNQLECYGHWPRAGHPPARSCLLLWTFDDCIQFLQRSLKHFKVPGSEECMQEVIVSFLKNLVTQ